jgi:hypothetical protein
MTVARYSFPRVSDDLGHVAAPQHVRGRSGELPTDPVRRRRSFALPGQATAPFRWAPGQAERGHPAGDGVLTDPPARGLQIEGDPR